MSLPRWAWAAMLAIVLGAAATAGARGLVQASRRRWVEQEALPAASRLIEQNRPLAALDLVSKAEALTTPSPALIRLKSRLGGVRASMRTTPPGALVYAILAAMYV